MFSLNAEMGGAVCTVLLGAVCPGLVGVVWSGQVEAINLPFEKIDFCQALTSFYQNGDLLKKN
jgi:hypothetical protein